MGHDEGLRLGLADAQGRVTLPPEYLAIEGSSNMGDEPAARVQAREGKWGYLHLPTARWLMEPQYDELLINHLNTDAAGMGLALVSQQGRWGIVTIRNEPRIPLVYARIKGWFGRPEAMGSQQYVRATRQGRIVEIRFDAETGRLLGESTALEERPVRYGGLGVAIVAQQGAVMVMAVHPKGAGSTGGLRAGERIEAIDGQSTAHMTVQDATLFGCAARAAPPSS